MRTALGWSRWRARLLLAIVLPVTTVVVWEGQRLMRADWASAGARNRVVEWVGGASFPLSVQAWDEAREALEASLAATPDDPDLHDRLGDLHTVAARRDGRSPVSRRDDFRLAALSYQRAVALRPSEPGTWAMLAAARQAAGEPPSSVEAAWRNARRLGPYDSNLQPTLLQVVLADWRHASPEMQDWAKSLFDHAGLQARKDINAMASTYGLVFQPDAATSPP